MAKVVIIYESIEKYPFQYFACYLVVIELVMHNLS